MDEELHQALLKIAAMEDELEEQHRLSPEKRAVMDKWLAQFAEKSPAVVFEIAKTMRKRIDEPHNG